MRALGAMLAVAVAFAASAAYAKVGDKAFVKPAEIKLRAVGSTSAPETGAPIKRNTEVTVVQLKPMWAQVEVNATKSKGWLMMTALSDRRVEVPIDSDRRLGTSGEFGSTAGSRGIGDMGASLKNANEITQADTDAVDFVTAFTPSGNVAEFAKEGGLNLIATEVQ